MSLGLTDSHTHLDSKEFDEDREACISRALEAGVSRILTVGAGRGLDSAYKAIELSERYPFIWCSTGVHPHDAAHDIDRDELSRLAAHPRVVAIGETGLDFFKEWSPVDRQREMFEVQIALAVAVNKPLIIHSRDAGAECLDTLRRLGADKVGGVFHCYAEDHLFAAQLREINFLVSFPGLLTFKKTEEIRIICKQIPLEQMMVETDAPYMAPEPHRGKRCEPAFVVETARRLATLKEKSLEEIAEVTTANALRLFSGMK